jgi:hypothetical protein
VHYYANPSTPAVREVMAGGLLGMIATPMQGQPIPPGAMWCADNGCYGSGYPGDDQWITWLASYSPAERARCAFATAPDVVGDATATATRAAPWLDRISQLGYPVAYVAQNGIEHAPPPWPRFDVLFIGGDTAWKLGPVARALVGDALAHGKRVHMGRVNSLRRMRYAESIGCHSADGTTITYGPDLRLPDVLSWLRAVNHQGVLW